MAHVVYPFKKFNYEVKFGNIANARFLEISSGEIYTDPLDISTGDVTKNTKRCLSGLRKFDNVTFQYGTTNDIELLEWIQKVDTGTKIPINIEIALYTPDSKIQQAGWILENARPVQYSLSDLKGERNEITFISLEVTQENIKRIK